MPAEHGWLSRLSIITVTCNSATSLEEFLGHMDADCRARLIVVDNGSRDGTLDLARREGLHVIPLAENRGFARAANVGARAAPGERLCFINPDCQPSRRLFQTGSAALSRARESCWTPEFREPNGRTVQGRQPGYTWPKLLADVLSSDYRLPGAHAWLNRWRGFHDRGWSWPLGACFFMSRQRFFELGGFDEAYFLYMEDVDLGRRHARHGGTIGQLPVSVFHASGQSSRHMGPFRREWLDRSRVRYALRHHGPLLGGLLWLATLPPRGYRRFTALTT